MVDVQIERPTTSVTDDAAALADTGVSLERGVAALRAALATMPAGAGVYCMRDRHEKPLYVGKAKSLKKRVATYVNVRTLPVRLQRMIAGTASVEVITTEGEVEALLLESNMIKRLKPHYNILLRDDKSFPYILLRRGHLWPQITKYRGAKSGQGDYFGPFASAGAVDLTINALQRAFPLRSCSDSVLESRTRPCLQYQIKRCTAPCVGRIGKADYDVLVEEARAFLAGRSREVQGWLTERMTAASDALEFETAAAFRDRIKLSPTSRCARASTCPLWAMRMSSPSTTRRARPVCRSSSSVRARTMAIGRSFRATPRMSRPRRSSAPSSASFTARGRRRRSSW